MWSAYQPLTSSLNPWFSISHRWWPKPTARSVDTGWTGSVVTQIQALVGGSSLPSSCRFTEYVSRERMMRTGEYGPVARREDPENPTTNIFGTGRNPPAEGRWRTGRPHP